MLKEKQQQIKMHSELVDFICKIQLMKNDLTKKSEENNYV